MIRYVFWFFWRIWFYILIMLPILVLAPILLLLVSSDKTYSAFFKIARFWGKFILTGMGFYIIVEGKEYIEKGKSYMLVANHTSMTDIMLMLAVVSSNPFVFVGKKELVNYPIFGYFYKRICIMVDRNNSKSRYKVFELAQQRLQQGLSICIFPEGGVPDDELLVLDVFKDGAFRLAIDHQIPIIALTFFDNKRRFPFRFFSGSMGKMRVRIHPPFETKGLTQDDKNNLKNSVRETILLDLEQDK